MAKKRTLTPNEKEYRKEVRRAQQFIYRAEGRGYRFNVTLPPQPKRITQASIRRIKKLTPTELYKKATYLDPETGDIVTGLQGRKLERTAAAKKAAKSRKTKISGAPTPLPPKGQPPKITDIVLRNLEDLIAKWQPYNLWSKSFTKIKEHDRNVLQNILKGAIAREGRDTVARRCEAHAEEILQLAENILYGQSGKFKDQIQDDLTRIAWILNNGPVSGQEFDALYDSEDVFEV